MTVPANRIVGAGDKEKRKASDFYPTPKEATFALLDLLAPYLRAGGVIWEPACGERDMVNAMRELAEWEGLVDLTTQIEYLSHETDQLVAECRRLVG